MFYLLFCKRWLSRNPNFGSNNVSVIDTASISVVANMVVGNWPGGVAFH
jgi:YVTN family beta-propeller protein